jgi:hypothetical protein
MPILTPIIGIKGPSQSGKTTIANALANLYESLGHPVYRTSFSGYVRQEIASFALHLNGLKSHITDHRDARTHNKLLSWGHVGEEILNHTETLLSTTDYTFDRTLLLATLEERPAPHWSRRLQQLWGQDFRRKEDPEYWVKKHFQDWATILIGDTPGIIIEESVRQPNEGRYIRSFSGVILEMEPVQSPTSEEAANSSHSVEQIANSWPGDHLINIKDWHTLSPESQIRLLLSVT